jgi:hypothetical protein
MELFSNEGFTVGSQRDDSIKEKKGGNLKFGDEGAILLTKVEGLYCEIVACPDEQLL